MKSGKYLLVSIVIIANAINIYAQPVRPPKPPPYSPSNGFKPIPRGEKDPCPSPGCDCIDLLPLQKIFDVNESVCYDCADGEKVYAYTYIQYLGVCYTNANCPQDGRLLQKIDIYQERQHRIIGNKVFVTQTRPSVTNPANLCVECPDCPDRMVDCVEVRREQCDGVDPAIDEIPNGKPICTCPENPA
jgi:hypothetical protein